MPRMQGNRGMFVRRGFRVFWAPLIASVMLAAEHKQKTALLASAAIGFATMLGVISVFLVAGLGGEVAGWAFAFSAGVATYVGASDLIPEINRSENRVIPLLVFAGMVLFYLGKTLVAGIVAE